MPNTSPHTSPHVSPHVSHHTALSGVDILARTGGQITGASPDDNRANFTITDITIDSRQCKKGSLFIALPGSNADGHDYVTAAAQNGASAVLIAHPIADADIANTDCVPILVDDTVQALDDLAVMGRIMHQQHGGRLIGVTGSVGKTGSKEMLAHILARMGGCHASKASFNNHVGVPLTLAALPEDVPVAIQEMGMNAAGEIANLSLMASPDIALITRIAESHSGFFNSLGDIAVAKAEIFDGMCGLGIAVLNRDDAFFDELSRRARLAGATRIITFGRSDEADFCLLSCAAPAPPTAMPTAMQISANCMGEPLAFTLDMAAPHWAMNALGVLAVVEALGLDVAMAAMHLADFTDLPGRGARHHGQFNNLPITLIDDSYNAGPASMAAAMDGLLSNPPQVMVLSDMLELGQNAGPAHDALIPAITALGPRVLIGLGAEMARMQTALASAPQNIECLHAKDAKAALAMLGTVVQADDTLFIKGSNGSGAHLVANGVIAGLNATSQTTGGASHAA